MILKTTVASFYNEVIIMKVFLCIGVYFIKIKFCTHVFMLSPLIQSNYYYLGKRVTAEVYIISTAYT